MPETGKTPLDSAAARLPRWMAGVSAVGVLAVLGNGHARAAGGFALGSAVAILAYWWLHEAVATALDSGEGRPPRGTMIKVAMRYPLLLIIVAVFYRTGWLPFDAVIAGLFVPLAGALIEGVTLAGRILLTSEAPGSAPLTHGGLTPENQGTPPAQLHP